MNMSSGQNFSMPSGGGDPSMHMRPDLMNQQNSDGLSLSMRGMDSANPYSMPYDMNPNSSVGVNPPSIRPPLGHSYPFNPDSTSPPFHPQQTRPWNMN